MQCFSSRSMNPMLLTLITFLALAAGSAYGQSRAIEEILLDQQIYFARLQSLQYTVERTVTYGDGWESARSSIAPGTTYTHPERFWLKGKLYRVETAATSPGTQKTSPFVATRNDMNFQVFSQNDKRLKQHTSPVADTPYFSENYFVSAFSFAFDQSSEYGFELGKDKTRWEELANSAEFVEEKEIRGHPVVVLRMTPSFVPENHYVDGQRISYVKVAFAEDMGHFPIEQSVYLDSGYRFSLLETDVERIESSTGSYVMCRPRWKWTS